MFKQIDEFVKWHRRRNPSARTWRDYKYDLTQFHDFVGAKEPKAVQVQDIDGFINHQSERGMSPKTINRRLTAIGSFYVYLSDTDPTITCPVIRRRHNRKEKQRLPKPVPMDEVKKFFDAIDNPRDMAMFQLMLRCGLRISEVAKITFADLHLKEDKPRFVVHGKNKRERSAYLFGKIEAVFRRYLAERPKIDLEAVFINCRNEPLTTMGIQKRLEKYRKLAGVDITAHQLRHNFANDLVMADVPVTTIQKLLGHAWVGTTQIYIAANDPKVKADFFDAIDKLEGWQ